ncbi:MAG TPA: hypothetical protein PKD86_07790 [Gemmatales bacterium]|nr:hypothetical protein [Gemmatales bacterium]HMP59239.1 hypothetical protein [Gemmatales bacterium]
MDWQVVHIRIADANSGQAIPVRLRLRGAEGQVLAPLGRWSDLTPHGRQAPGHVLVDGELCHYVEGACEARLPAGAIEVVAAHGPGYHPTTMTWTRRAGQVALRCALSPRRQPAAEGWYAGDPMVTNLSPQAAWLEGAGEGLSVVLLAATDERSLLDFSAQAPALERTGTLVAVGTWNGHGTTTGLLLHHSHRVVFPLRLADEGFQHYTVDDWAQQCHRKRGWVIWPVSELDAEVMATLLHDQIDALGITLDTNPRDALKLAYQLWDADRPVGLVAGSAKTDALRAVGCWRTWVQLPPGEPLTFTQWIESARLRRAFISRGPWLHLEVNGQGPGAVFSMAPSRLQLRALAADVEEDVDLEVVSDGEVVASAVGSEQVQCELAQAWPDAGWVAVRCWSRGGELLAHSNPVTLGGGQSRRTQAREHLLGQLSEKTSRLSAAEAKRLSTSLTEARAHWEALKP